MAEISLIFLGSTVMLSFIVAAALQYFNGTAIAIFTPRYRYMVALVFVTSFVSVFIPLMLRYGPSLFRSGRKPPPMPAGREISVAPKPRAVDDALPRPDRGDTTEESQSPDRILTGKAEPHEELAAEPAEDASPPDPSAAKVSAALLNFTGHSLEAIAATDRQLDSFNRFGLTLFFAGAADCLASSERLSEGDIEDLLRTQMQMLGHTPEMATRFCANMVDYLVNPKNFTMYEAGRAAVVRYQRQPKNEAGVVAAMERWTNPDAPVAKNAKEFVAILFTDIVGSTAMTQERGDDGAQLVVHKHNEIVRDALAQHGGREIKHTGDGIMATFPQIASSVDCAISMQKQCARANAADAGLGLVLSIGINAGEPIHERGDIFGTPVQMAARVLGKAEGNEIAVSNIVREMCAGKSYAFTKKGDYELKGFAEPVPVYLVGR